MERNEISAVYQEIEAIKKEAYNKGRMDEYERLRNERTQLEKRAKETALLRTEWMTMVAMVKDSYLEYHERELKLVNEHNSIYHSYSPDDQRLTVPADMNAFQEEVARLVRMGKDFEILLKGINENEVLKGTWNKLLMAFRLIEI